MRHAILGAGGIGSLLGAALARAGADVVLVLRDETLAAYDGRIVVESAVLGDFAVEVPAAPELDRDVEALWVATKATQLERALERAEPARVGGAAVLPLLNGVDHVAFLRARYENVVAAAIRVESERLAPGRVRQRSPFLRVDVAGSDAVAAELAASGIDTRVHDDELTLLWEKLAFLAPLALATTALAAPLGEAREDERLWASLEEASAVARAEGASVAEEAVRSLVRSAPASMRSSMQKDVATGREPELDAVAGPVQRGGRRHGIPVPATDSLADAVRARFA